MIEAVLGLCNHVTVPWEVMRSPLMDNNIIVYYLLVYYYSKAKP